MKNFAFFLAGCQSTAIVLQIMGLLDDSVTLLHAVSPILIALVAVACTWLFVYAYTVLDLINKSHKEKTHKQ